MDPISHSHPTLYNLFVIYICWHQSTFCFRGELCVDVCLYGWSATSRKCSWYLFDLFVIYMCWNQLIFVYRRGELRVDVCLYGWRTTCSKLNVTYMSLVSDLHDLRCVDICLYEWRAVSRQFFILCRAMGCSVCVAVCCSVHHNTHMNESCLDFLYWYRAMGWLRLVGSLKS